MKCFRQAELKRSPATFTDSRKGHVIVPQDIPAWGCSQCGESLFDADAVRRIQDVLHAVDDRVEKLRRAA